MLMSMQTHIEPSEDMHVRRDVYGNSTPVPLRNTQYDEFVTRILERARHHASIIKPNVKQFELFMIEEEWKQCACIGDILSPLFKRAPEYGLEPVSTFHEKILFRVLRP